jgi:hypothetical protein
VVGYWQIIFMQGALKWDSLGQYLPCRFFVSESIREGQLPLWCPYMLSGYPIHADPQSGAWYPFVWFYSFFHQYDLYALHIEFFFHVFFASVGMFVFTNYLIKNKYASLLAAIMYVLSGFFIGNAQHLTYIIAGCWIPWFLFSYLCFLQTPSLKNLLGTALLFFLLVSGAYPAFTIIIAYSAGLLFLYQMLKKIKNCSDGVKQLLVYSTVLFFLVITMSSVVIVSQYYLSDYYTRSKILTWVQMNNGSFSPQSLLSLLFPLASATDDLFFRSDISMSNIYAGILFVVFLLATFFRKLMLYEKILLCLSLLFLLFALGEYTPFRGWLGALPFLGWFRFPALFRFFVLLFSLPVIVNSVLHFLSIEYRKTIRSISFFVLAVLTTVIIAYSDSFKTIFPDLFSCKWSSFIQRFNFKEAALLNSLFGSVFILLFLLSTVTNFKSKYLKWKYVILFLMVTDLIVVAQMNAPATVTNINNVKNIQSRIDRAVKKRIALPPLISPANFTDSTLKNFNPVMNNLGVYYHVPSIGGLLTFTLTGYEKFTDHPFQQKIIQNNWAYLSPLISYYQDSILVKDAATANQRTLFLNYEDQKELKQNLLREDRTATVLLEKFSPHEIAFNVSNTSTQMFTLMQQFYPGWQASVNGKPAKIFIANYLHISIPVKAGLNKVSFVFKNAALDIAFIVSATAFVISLLLSIHFLTKRII